MQPAIGTREMTLALILHIFGATMVQDSIFFLVFVPHMNVMLFQFLDLLHMQAPKMPQALFTFLESLIQPSLFYRRLTSDICWRLEKCNFVTVFRPFALHLSAFSFLPVAFSPCRRQRSFGGTRAPCISNIAQPSLDVL